MLLLLTFALTVFVDLTVAIGVGVTLASLLFVARMAKSIEISKDVNKDVGQLDENENQREVLPKGVEVFWIAGPIFFAIASDILELFKKIGDNPKVLILRMRLVPFLDQTGALALNDLVKQCRHRGMVLIFSALQNQPAKILKEFHREKKWNSVYFANSYEEALELAKEFQRTASG
jgi:SulP family sulfate permease